MICDIERRFSESRRGMLNKSSTGIVRAILTVVIVGISSHDRLVQSQDNMSRLRDRFLEESPRASDLLEQLTFRAKCLMEQEYSTTSASFQTTLKQRYGGAGQPDAESFETLCIGRATKEAGVIKGVEYIMARNPRYAFRITRGPEANRYAITWLEELGVDPEKDRFVAKESRQALAFPLAAAFPFGMTMAELVDSPHFELQQVSPSKENDDLIQVTFEYQPKEERKHLTNAYMICDPQLHWAVRETRATIWGGATLHTVIEFGKIVSGFPLAKIVTSTNKADNPDVTLERTTTVNVSVAKDLIDAEFYLSHYGLPEPNFERSWYGSWLIYLIGGAGCLAVAFAIRRRRAAV
ncbi:MAG: hypothetical protein AB7I48_19555 [Planctomycetaceae bacterium]